jgi:hypothetical protein
MKRAVLFVVVLLLGCSGSTAPSPFVRDAGASDAADAGPIGDDSGADASTLGGPCLDDSQCDDGVDCTVDRCEKTLGRCRSTPDPSLCDNGVYCDGVEVCDPKLGCIAGVPVACSDDNTCTVDRCVESTQSCGHTPRDADGDGDPPWNCPGGGDCNDNDPLVSSKSPEVCGNGIDDNCNGQVDEKPCSTPEHDTCVDPLLIKASGNYSMSLVAAASDYSASCAGAGTTWRDVVAAIVVPSGPAVDVDITATTPSGNLALASAAQCGDPSGEIGCAASVTAPAGGSIARLRLRALSSGNYPLYVFGDGQNDVQLAVEFMSPEPKPTNETCGTAATLTPGVHEQVPIIDAAKDVPSDCGGALGELVYKFTLPGPRDVHLYASSLDGYGSPSLSLRDAACSGKTDELTCRDGPVVDLYERGLPAGDYYVAVSADAPSVLDLLLQLSPATSPPPDESCSGSPALAPGTTIDVPLLGHTDDIQLGCVKGAPDAAYTLDLAQKSDVLLVERISNGDTGGVGLDKAPCGEGDVLSCGTSGSSPNRAAAYGVVPGSYRAVVEAVGSTPTQLTAFTRPATPPVFVAFSDTCADAVEIPPAGGRFQGTTANASADYDVGCDLGAQPPGGAPDQMLHLSLSKKQRVVFDMKGSSYNTLLDVRRGPSCPGQEVALACAAGYVADRSYLDLTLDAGDYYVQIDGYAGASGSWSLDVYTADP